MNCWHPIRYPPQSLNNHSRYRRRLAVAAERHFARKTEVVAETIATAFYEPERVGFDHEISCFNQISPFNDLTKNLGGSSIHRKT